jgi:hypothetical protein
MIAKATADGEESVVRLRRLVCTGGDRVVVGTTLVRLGSRFISIRPP